MNRRQFAVTSLASVVPLSSWANHAVPPVNMGLLIYSYGKRAQMEKEKGFSDPVRFLEFAKSRGANAVQMPLGQRSEAECKSIRQSADKWNMHIEGILSPPKNNTQDLERFQSELTTIQACGVDLVRMVMLGGRRYEVFESAEQYTAFAKQSIDMLQRAEPLARKKKIHLAIENHKDFRTTEQIDLLKKFDSEWLGICLDTGNNLSLLEDPNTVIRTLAPLTRTVHLKDIGVEETTDGFRMAEVPLGQGIFDLPTMVTTIQKANPKARFHLEMITRDPLSIPCLTDKYWATLSQVPGRDLARTLQQVRQGTRKTPLPILSKMPMEQQRQLEDQNVQDSFAAAARIGLGTS